MKILIIANSINPQSGAGRYAWSIIDEFLCVGVNVLVVTEKSGIESEQYHKNILFPAVSVLNFVRNVYQVRQLVKKEKISIVHAFDGWPYGVYAYFAVLGTSVRLFVSGVGTYSIVPKRFSAKRILMLRMYERARAVPCISKYTEKRILESVPDVKTQVVFLGKTELPTPSFDLIQKTQERYCSDAPSPVLLSVGAIKHRKGQLDVARALLCIKKIYPRVRYLIVGSDEDSGYVRKIKTYAEQNDLKDNITIITTAQTDEDLAVLYEISDIFVLASNTNNDHFEGFGLVFLEAYQFGKPGIGTLGSGIEDAVKDGYNGFLVKQQDTATICSSVIKLMQKEYKTYAKNAKEFASRFSWKRTADIYFKMYGQ